MQWGVAISAWKGWLQFGSLVKPVCDSLFSSRRGSFGPGASLQARVQLCCLRPSPCCMLWYSLDVAALQSPTAHPIRDSWLCPRSVPLAALTISTTITCSSAVTVMPANVLVAKQREKTWITENGRNRVPLLCDKSLAGEISWPSSSSAS